MTLEEFLEEWIIQITLAYKNILSLSRYKYILEDSISVIPVPV